jgi:hypothetical protein
MFNADEDEAVVHGLHFIARPWKERDIRRVRTDLVGETEVVPQTDISYSKATLGLCPLTRLAGRIGTARRSCHPTMP